MTEGELRVAALRLAVEKKHLDKKAKAEENRRRMPIISGVVDSFRDAFGEANVKVVYVKENGIVMGKQGGA